MTAGSSGPVASLPMHDHPSVRWATDALWQALSSALAERGEAAPVALDRRPDYASVWLEPGLILSQTCGYPYVTRLRGHVRLVATPVYRADGCDAARYRSVLLVRTDDRAESLADLRGRRVALNADNSQSGRNALRAAVAPLAHDGRFFGGSILTGRHRASAKAVVDGAADLCAIDCVSWALLRRHEPERTQGLRAIGWTASAPGLPLITGLASNLPAIRAAVAAVMVDPGLVPAREAMLIEAVEILSDADYAPIMAMEREAIASGYPDLA